jgi:hypothetical protein
MNYVVEFDTDVGSRLTILSLIRFLSWSRVRRIKEEGEWEYWDEDEGGEWEYWDEQEASQPITLDPGK